MVEKITSRNNPKIKALNKLPKDLFLVEGFHLVEMALKHHYVEEIYSTKKLYPNFSNIPQYLISDNVLDKLTFTKSPEGVVALCYKEKKEIDFSLPSLYLDDVQDPGNVGTILRTALSFGFKNVLLGEGSSSPYSNKAIMASQGAIFDLNISQSSIDPLLILENFKKEGYLTLSTSLKNAVPLSSFMEKEKNLSPKILLILGNEGRGVKEEINKNCDYSIKIEMSNIDSLNVAIAGGILMYNLSRRMLDE